MSQHTQSPPPIAAQEKPWAIILAAGSGTRLAAATCGHAKQFLSWQERPLYWHSAMTMCRSAAIAGLVFVFPPCCLEDESARLRRLWQQDDPGLPCVVAAGGQQRQDSVRLGLEALPRAVRQVLVHDSARPFLQAALVHRVADALQAGAVAVIPGLPLTDTVKMVQEDRVTATLPREKLVAVQTPQGFDVALLRRAHALAVEKNLQVTDDAALMEYMEQEVRVVPGDSSNVKITRPEDLSLLTAPTAVQPCCGMGYDVHRYVEEGRPLRLGGVLIPQGPAIKAHSDGDVLLHALMDGLLGCASLGDIGQHFPDSDAKLDNISSAVLLDQVLSLLAEAGVRICHVDLTIVAQKPRLAPYREEIRANVARLLSLDRARVNLKATTEEGLGFTGRAEGIKAYAMISAERVHKPCPAGIHGQEPEKD